VEPDLTTQYLAVVRQTLDRIETTQAAAVGAAARICADAIDHGGITHVFGTGHSIIPVMEMFPRYGSFPGFHPINELSMTAFSHPVGANGLLQAMTIERTPDLARLVLEASSIDPPDALIICSSSGTNAVPVEMAVEARARSVPVIALTSVDDSRASELGAGLPGRLFELADVVLDTCTPVGDAMVAFPEWDTRIAPGSTIAAAALINMLKIGVAELLAARGHRLPVITRASLAGSSAARASVEDAVAAQRKMVLAAWQKNA
jgi:uncharacterized phosphosugar-binding protein